MEALSSEWQSALVPSKVARPERLVQWWSHPHVLGCSAIPMFSTSAPEQKELCQPKREGEEDPTCSGTISEVLATGQPIGDLTTLGRSPVWSWCEGTAQELH